MLARWVHENAMPYSGRSDGMPSEIWPYWYRFRRFLEVIILRDRRLQDA